MSKKQAQFSEIELARKELFDMKFRHSVGMLDDTSAIKKKRKEVARLLTKMNSGNTVEAA